MKVSLIAFWFIATLFASSLSLSLENYYFNSLRKPYLKLNGTNEQAVLVHTKQPAPVVFYNQHHFIPVIVLIVIVLVIMLCCLSSDSGTSVVYYNEPQFGVVSTQMVQTQPVLLTYQLANSGNPHYMDDNNKVCPPPYYMNSPANGVQADLVKTVMHPVNSNVLDNPMVCPVNDVNQVVVGPQQLYSTAARPMEKEAQDWSNQLIPNQAFNCSKQNCMQ